MAASAATKGPARKESSFASVVSDLEYGEIASKVMEIAEQTRLVRLSEGLVESRKAHRNNVMTAVQFAKRATGNHYSVEVVDLFTNGRLFLVALVTRTA